MCIFGYDAPTKSHLDVPREKAFTAYKVLSLKTWGEFRSPFQDTHWRTKTLTAPRLGHHDSGIYAMKTVSGAISNGTHGSRNSHVVVKVALYGDVMEYGHRRQSGGYGYRHAGYRAQHCEIVEVLPPQPGVPNYYSKRRSAPRPYYGHLRSDLKRMMPEMRKRYEGVKFPTYKSLGL